jgi:hypothetical protein
MAMERAGFARNQYTLLVQDYPSPLPARAAEFRFRQEELRAPSFFESRRWRVVRTGGRSARTQVGGCPFLDRDAEWANTTALRTIDGAIRGAYNRVRAAGRYQVAFMELERAFSPNAGEAQGRRLCETGLTLVGGEGRRPSAPRNWQTPNAARPTTVDNTEWINQLRFLTLNTPFFQQESIHPNFWGQLALRNCVRKAYNAGAPRGGECLIERRGLTAAPGGVAPVVRREPLMQLR